eukprot:TRINITY_DN3450_c0_g2_i1.p1 TRINITY_DN3450_c0_g2~~TRINITY_DN3450_c0_g2_i1.p1  ORF type:complete len:634 (+),score=170.12 TRINITY_DN3450_c0_g2_i1:179-1903(+)
MPVENYGLFLPSNEESVGQWLREDYPLDFYQSLYGFEGEEVRCVRDSKAHSSSKKTPDFLEWKSKYRAVRVLVHKEEKMFLINDTTKVSGIIDIINTEFGSSIAIYEDLLFSNGDDDVEVLSNDMTLREQGYHGDCIIGLFSKVHGSLKRTDIGLYIKLPFCEGYLKRKGGFPTWKKRWYVLKKNKLHNYKSDKALKKELGHLPIKTVKELRATPSTLSDVPKKQQTTCFEVVTQDRAFKLLAKSVEDKELWLKELDLARRMFGDEADLEEAMSAQRKLLEPQLAPPRLAQSEGSRLIRGENDAQMKFEQLQEQLKDLDRSRRQDEDLFLLLSVQLDEINEESGDLKEEIEEGKRVLERREEHKELIELVNKQRDEIEQEQVSLQQQIAKIQVHKKAVSDRLRRNDDYRKSVTLTPELIAALVGVNSIDKQKAELEKDQRKREEELLRLEEDEIAWKDDKDRRDQTRAARATQLTNKLSFYPQTLLQVLTEKTAETDRENQVKSSEIEDRRKEAEREAESLKEKERQREDKEKKRREERMKFEKKRQETVERLQEERETKRRQRKEEERRADEV